MRIRTKILSSYALLAATVALICLVIVSMPRVADENRRQSADSYEQLRNIDLIATEANHFIEQIAELIIIGPQGADIDHARTALMEHIAVQRALVSDEVDRLTDPEERAGEFEEIDLIGQIERVVGELDRVYERLARAVAAGRRDAADALYRDEVENRLDDGLGALIGQALARRKRVVLAPRQPFEPAIVRGDAERLRQAVLIVLDNARARRHEHRVRPRGRGRTRRRSGPRRRAGLLLRGARRRLHPVLSRRRPNRRLPAAGRRHARRRGRRPRRGGMSGKAQGRSAAPRGRN